MRLSGVSGPAATTLRSWKEIADYLGRALRTVQRWHIELGLPVHRIDAQQRSAVFAHTTELDDWLAGWKRANDKLSASSFDDKYRTYAGVRERATIARRKAASYVAIRRDLITHIIAQARENTANRQQFAYAVAMNNAQIGEVGFRFLLTDVKLALTLVWIASCSKKNEVKRARNVSSARRAYDSVYKLSKRAMLTDVQQQELDAELAKLKAELDRLRSGG